MIKTVQIRRFLTKYRAKEVFLVVVFLLLNSLCLKNEENSLFQKDFQNDFRAQQLQNNEPSGSNYEVDFKPYFSANLPICRAVPPNLRK